jgi:hypothetical protein
MTLAVSILGTVLLGWAVALALFLGFLWARGAQRSAQHRSWSDGESRERRVGERRRADNGPPAGVPERRAGLDRRVQLG